MNRHDCRVDNHVRFGPAIDNIVGRFIAQLSGELFYHGILKKAVLDIVDFPLLIRFHALRLDNLDLGEIEWSNENFAECARPFAGIGTQVKLVTEGVSRHQEIGIAFLRRYRIRSACALGTATQNE